jgi:hypothetical protein
MYVLNFFVLQPTFQDGTVTMSSAAGDGHNCSPCPEVSGCPVCVSATVAGCTLGNPIAFVSVFPPPGKAMESQIRGSRASDSEKDRVQALVRAVKALVPLRSASFGGTLRSTTSLMQGATTPSIIPM